MNRMRWLAVLLLLPWLLGGCGGGGGAPGGGAGNVVTLRTFMGDTPANALWVAYQDGDGAWQVLPAPSRAVGEYTFQVNDPNGRYGVVVVCQRSEMGNTQTEVDLYYATTGEFTTLTHVCEAPAPTTRYTISGTVSGVGSGEFAMVAMGQETAMVNPDGTYSLQVPPGTYDLVAVRWTSGEVGRQVGQSVNKFVVRRDITVSGDATYDLDFNGSEAFDPVSYTVTVSGLSRQQWQGSGFVDLVTKNGTQVPLGFAENLAAPFVYYAFPSTHQLAEDFYRLFIFVVWESAFREVFRHFASPTNVTLSLPAILASAQTTLVNTVPYLILRSLWASYTGAQGYMLEYQTLTHRWQVILTLGWLGTLTQWTMPDFSNLSGWQSDWGLPPGTSLSWRVAAFLSNLTLAQLAAAGEIERLRSLEFSQSGVEGTLSPD